jgi:hypothetical protein
MTSGRNRARRKRYLSASTTLGEADDVEDEQVRNLRTFTATCRKPVVGRMNQNAYGNLMPKHEPGWQLLYAIAAALQTRRFGPKIILPPRGRGCERNGTARR